MAPPFNSLSRKLDPRTPVGNEPSGTLPSAAGSRPELADPYIGTTFGGRYEIVSKIAEGSQGRVYVARHLLIERLVAIKVLFLTLASENALVSRFLNEGRAAGTLGHPNIVECVDMGYATDGAPYLVMELLAGQTLAQGIDTLGPFLHGRAAYIAMQIASALGAAHERGIVHRDLKPENVFLVDHSTRPDHVKILDFGISKFASEGTRVQTSKGQFLGTPGFMAPEQIDDPASVDARADVYALGATLYHMLAGEPPFANIDFPKVLRFISEEEPRPLAEMRPDLPPSVIEIVERAMSKSRDTRYQTMAELEEALAPHALEPVRRRALTSAPSESRLLVVPASHSSPSAAADSSRETLAEPPPPDRRARLFAGGLVVGAAICAAAGVFVFARGGATPNADLAKPTTTAVSAGLTRTPSAPLGLPATPPQDLAQPAMNPAGGATPTQPGNQAAQPENRATAAGAAVPRGTVPRSPLVPRPKPGTAVHPPDAHPPAAAGTATAAPPADTNATCTPPFYFDGRKKIFKPECI